MIQSGSDVNFAVAFDRRVTGDDHPGIQPAVCADVARTLDLHRGIHISGRVDPNLFIRLKARRLNSASSLQSVLHELPVSRS